MDARDHFRRIALALLAMCPCTPSISLAGCGGDDGPGFAPVGPGGASGDDAAEDGADGAADAGAGEDAAGDGPIAYALDPDRVYVTGQAASWVFFDPFEPFVGVGAFGGPSRRNALRPDIGRIIYHDPTRFLLYEHRCVGPCRVTATDLPADWQDDDPMLAAPPCDGDVVRRYGYSRDGSRYHQCHSEPEGMEGYWYDEDGEPLAYRWGTSSMMRVFHDDGFVIDAGSGLVISSLRDPDVEPVSPAALAFVQIIGARSREGGFAVVVSPALTAPPELWHVDFEGNAEHVASYPSLPDTIAPVIPGALDPQERLIETGTDYPDGTPGGVDVVWVRRSGADAIEFLYRDEGDAPVRIPHQGFVSGF